MPCANMYTGYKQQIDHCDRSGPVCKEIACKNLRHICCNDGRCRRHGCLHIMRSEMYSNENLSNAKARSSGPGKPPAFSQHVV